MFEMINIIFIALPFDCTEKFKIVHINTLNSRVQARKLFFHFSLQIVIF